MDVNERAGDRWPAIDGRRGVAFTWIAERLWPTSTTARSPTRSTRSVENPVDYGIDERMSAMNENKKKQTNKETNASLCLCKPRKENRERARLDYHLRDLIDVTVDDSVSSVHRIAARIPFSLFLFLSFSFFFVSGVARRRSAVDEFGRTPPPPPPPPPSGEPTEDGDVDGNGESDDDACGLIESSDDAVATRSTPPPRLMPSTYQRGASRRATGTTEEKKIRQRKETKK